MDNTQSLLFLNIGRQKIRQNSNPIEKIGYVIHSDANDRVSKLKSPH